MRRVKTRNVIGDLLDAEFFANVTGSHEADKVIDDVEASTIKGLGR